MAERLLSPTEALKLLLERASEPPTEVVAAQGASGCVASPLISRVCLPSYPRSILDGYAVRSEDVTRPGAELRVVGYAAPDTEAPPPVGPGEAVRVDTGAPLPPGADTVVPVEFTEQAGSIVAILELVPPGSGVAWPCSDAAPGEQVVVAGEEFTPWSAAAAASLGLRGVQVRWARVAVVPTGGEVVEPPGEQVEPPTGRVWESSGRGVVAELEPRLCGSIELHPPVPDDEDALRSVVEEYLARGYWMILLVGGTSAGAGDLAPKVISSFGEVLVHGLRVKPGKPTVIGVSSDGRPLIALPGNPLSALNVVRLLIEPLLEARGLLRGTSGGRVEARLLSTVPAPPGRRLYAPAYLLPGGAAYVKPVESYQVVKAAQADGIAEVPVVHGALPEGSRITVEVTRSRQARVKVLAEPLLGAKAMARLATEGVRVVEAPRRVVLAAAAAGTPVVSSKPVEGAAAISLTLWRVERARGRFHPAYPEGILRELLPPRPGEPAIPVQNVRQSAELLRRGLLSRALLPEPVEGAEELRVEVHVRPRWLAELLSGGR